jgi:hypothetical protein
MRTIERDHSLPSRAAVALALAALAGLALIAVGCGSDSSGSGVTQAPTTSTETQPSQSGRSQDGGSRSGNPAAYSACMRRNGVPKFPDPDANGRLSIIGGPGLDPNSPRFKAAEKACKKLLPRGGDDRPSPQAQARGLQEALRYSACMRENGVPNFPDPKTNAEGGIELSAGSGLDPSSPQYKAAEKACKELAPGANGGAFQQRNAPGATP